MWYPRAMEHPGDGYTIREAAEILGLSTRQVERYIQSGRLLSIKTPGKYGYENRIPAIPSDFIPSLAPDKTSDKPPTSHAAPAIEATDNPSNRVVDMPIDTPRHQLVQDLVDRIAYLSAQVGQLTERNMALEGKVKLLTAAASRPWWRRLLSPWSKATVLALCTGSITFGIVAFMEAMETRNTLNWFMGT